MKEATNSVNNSCHREQTFQKTPYIIQSYGQLMKLELEIGINLVGSVVDMKGHLSW